MLMYNPINLLENTWQSTTTIVYLHLNIGSYVGYSIGVGFEYAVYTL